jgi:hypothetical protein
MIVGSFPPAEMVPSVNVGHATDDFEHITSLSNELGKLFAVEETKLVSVACEALTLLNNGKFTLPDILASALRGFLAGLLDTSDIPADEQKVWQERLLVYAFENPLKSLEYSLASYQRMDDWRKVFPSTFEAWKEFCSNELRSGEELFDEKLFDAQLSKTLQTKFESTRRRFQYNIQKFCSGLLRLMDVNDQSIQCAKQCEKLLLEIGRSSTDFLPQPTPNHSDESTPLGCKSRIETIRVTSITIK